MGVAALVIAGAVLAVSGTWVIVRRDTAGSRMAAASPFVRQAITGGRMREDELPRLGARYMAVPMGVFLVIFGVVLIIAGVAHS